MRHDNRGVISLVVTVIIGLLFNVIAIGAVAVNTAELRQAADFDQSTKAYYAAEIAVEDFIAYVHSVLEIPQPAPRSTNNSCNSTYDGLRSLPLNVNNVSIICQAVTIDNNGTPGNPDDDEYIVDAAGKAGDIIRRVKVRLPIPN